MEFISNIRKLSYTRPKKANSQSERLRMAGAVLEFEGGGGFWGGNKT